ncbi:P-loop containing nucleoside triphosphate hydrolase protein [Butyriboletus roseoflavus]|nr:P-loop containing nucleoside triphosphate hydrolase protein [Butyriboletus roseoflavus]
MDLTGLEEVKEQILRIKAKIDTMKRQGVALDKERLNLVLLGNPRTGKTTVAKLYSQFLESIQVLPGDAFMETTGSKLSNEGVGGAQNLINQALQVGGGAIFIDEAYQLTNENSGKQVLDFLLAEMENRVGTLIFVLAGYNKEMEKFFEHNPGLPSRVPYRLQFADYTDVELMTMLEDLILKRYQSRMDIEDGIRGLYSRVAVRRLGRSRGVPGFGNARALQNMFANVCERQAERVEKVRRAGAFANDFFMTKEDLIGPDPSQIPNNATWTELQGLIGLDSVKQSVRNFFALVETNYHRELEEKEPLQMSLNRVFLGSPGTGKTTVAKLYGQVLVDLGLLIVVKNPSDFVGAYLGLSEKNTRTILNNTRGKVLVIDEAYMLYSGKSHGQDSFKTTVIDTIVAEIQSVPGEDRCVLLLGYKEQMEEMFQNVNPGLARRFAIENAFNFEDFTEPQLMDIFNYKLKKQDLATTDDAMEVARDLLSRMKDRPNFGNAGEVENMLSLAKDRYQKRMSSVLPHQRSDVVFEPQDLDPDFDRSQNASANLAKMFEDVIGGDEVIQRLDKDQKIARTMKAQGLDMRKQIPSNFIFKGPPGEHEFGNFQRVNVFMFVSTFKAPGKRPLRGKLVKCTTIWVCGTDGTQNQEALREGAWKSTVHRRGVPPGSEHFAQEAMDEIVDIMTKEKFMNKLVIILAGYDDEMNKLLKVNPGLSSHISEEIHFHNMTPDQCLALLDKDLRKSNIVVTEMADPNSQHYQQMRTIVSRMSILSSWGNARDIKTLGKHMFQQAFANASNGSGPPTLVVAEAIDIMQSMLKEQRERLGVPSSRTVNLPPPVATNFGAPPPPPTASSSSSQSSKHPPPPPSSNVSKPPPPQSSSPKSGGSQPLPVQTPRNDRPSKQRGGQTASTKQSTLTRQTTQTKPAKSAASKIPFVQSPPSQVSRALAQTADSSSHVERDPGVSDEDWNQLQADKRAAEEQKRRAKEEQDRLQRQLREAREAEERAKQRAAARERVKQQAAVDKVEQERVQRELEAARKREAEAKAARERVVAELKRKQQEEAQRQLRQQEIQRRLGRSGRCPMGYRWVQQLGGWRCEGGSHFVGDQQLSHI